MIGKAASNPSPLLWWEVVKTRESGEIHGARRAVGDKFQAPESAMTFDRLEGLVVKTTDPAAPKTKAKDEAAK